MGEILSPSPLMLAARAGITEDVSRLLTEGSDINCQDSEGWTPLMWASDGGHEEVVRLLLEAGANVDQPSKKGFTPLMVAACKGQCGVAR